MMTLEKLIADRLASPDHCEYLGSNTSRFIEESEKKYREIFDKDIVTKAEKDEMDNLHRECVAETETEQYYRGFFDALALVPGHGLTEEGMLAAIERAKDEQETALAKDMLLMMR